MDKLFDSEDADSDVEIGFKTENVFAKKYDHWRRKEELHKLQTKYGPDALLPDMESESSESESEDENAQISEEFEKDFLKTLSLLKDKDPRIYDSNFKCFQEGNVEESKSDENSKDKHKPIKVRDYERMVILNKDKLDDEDFNSQEVKEEESQPYVEEQIRLKENLKSFLKDDENNDDGDIAGLFKKRQKSQKELDDEEQGYCEWLKGQTEHLANENEEVDLKALKQFWSKPDLDEKDAFLRDYVLNRRYLDNANNGYIPSYDEIVHDSDGNLSNDEETIKQQVTFERKYNFRFEEPDPEFIKKYPRTIENSMRPQNNKRAEKRHEIKERKAEEKKKKFEEIGRLKALKLKEIQEKIAKLKEITGNEELAFQDEDIMEDFNPEAHDKRMKELFNEEYYDEEGDAEKPEFPELDEELEIEKDWDLYEKEALPENQNTKEMHCEDEDFNMDADFVPTMKANKATEETGEPGSKRRKRKRKSKLAEILASEKPKYDPMSADKTYAEHMDEYYKIDCEDIIGDLPCRFKYTETVPNDYGLTIEEILLADDKELNQWYSLKKSLKNKPEYQERGEVKAYKMRAENIKLKRKYLPSLFRNIGEDPEDKPDIVAKDNRKIKKKKKKKNKLKIEPEDTSELPNNSISDTVTNTINDSKTEKKKKKEKKSASPAQTVSPMNIMNDSKPETKKKKKNKSTQNITSGITPTTNDIMNTINDSKSEKKKKRKNPAPVTPNDAPDQNGEKKNRKRKLSQVDVAASLQPEVKEKKQKRNKKKRIKPQNKIHQNSSTNTKKNDPLHSLTDERLKAYGLNPKKYKNFLRFKKY